MKNFLLSLGLVCAALGAHAQILPVPGAQNPDWALEKSKARSRAEPADVLPGTDRMPNAGQQSIKSIGNHHYHWDSNRQLAYEWLSRPGSGSTAPDKLVVVRSESAGTYTYRSRSR